MKKLILLLTVTIYAMFSGNMAYGASYLPAASGDHNVYVANLNASVSSYLNNHGNQIGNIESIRNIVYNSISSQGGWYGPGVGIPHSTWVLIARVENGRLIVGCGNADLISFAINPSSVNPHTYTSQGTCSSYISNWVENWSNCNLSGNWNTDGKINCNQINTWSPVYSSCGVNTYNYTSTCYGSECNDSAHVYSCNLSNCLSNVVKPADVTDVITVIAKINIPTSNCLDLYADNYSTCGFMISISGTPKDNKPIVGLSGLEVKNIQDKSNVSANRIDGSYNSSNNNALNFSGVSNTDITGNGTNYQINISGIKARSPFLLNTGKVSFDLKGTISYTTIDIDNIKYSFKKPFIGFLKSSLDGVNWSDLPIIGTVMNYKLMLQSKSSLTLLGLQNFKISDFKNKIYPGGDDLINLVLQNVNVNTGTLDDKNGAIFSARINTSSGIFETLPKAGLQVRSPYVEYKMEGHSVKYILSNDVLPNDTSPIDISNSEFLGVKIVGSLQGSGKQSITGQNENFSDLSRSSTSTEIRKNAYVLTKSMNSGETLNGVKYVVGDITVSGEPDYETLIVKDGNVKISADLNVSGKKFGVIVLKDNYNTLSDYQNKGNIYVDSSVKIIKGVFYADGGFISSYNGIPYLTDSSNRTATLQNQLYLKGTLFTRNTIGGAILSGGYYILPGGSKTSDFDKAMVYDLNYIRRGNTGCDKGGNPGCNDSGEYNDSLIIIYDSKIQLDPPKGFGG